MGCEHVFQMGLNVQTQQLPIDILHNTALLLQGDLKWQANRASSLRFWH